MLHYIYAHDLQYFPRLRDSMFRDRADQFKRRLGWDVRVNAAGEERDEYDAINPLYLIWQNPDGTHGGSMRYLPTTGDTMVNDHFSYITGGRRIENPFIWEVTRFCLSPNSDRQVTAALTVGAGEIMEAFNLRQFVGVFDRSAERVYKMMGFAPDLLGQTAEGRDYIGVGLWKMRPEMFGPMLERAGFDRATSRHWFETAFDFSKLEQRRAVA